MEQKEEKKKESALNINDDFDFIFAKKIPDIIRWLLVIPAGFVGLLMVQLAYGFVVGMLLKNISETSMITTIVNAIFGFVKFYIFTIAMVAMAPVSRSNKFKTGIGFAIVPLAVAAGATYILILGASQASAEYVYSTTEVAIQVIVVVLATIVALAFIRRDTNKEKVTVEAGSELNE